ncbi:MAG: 30S ribosomal protein S4 [Bacteroidetes bacterium]|jgi:small subunit ribosomal protein S4|nr:30S ribosomal protein S4 [Bacteroidota bacterium]
MARYTGPKTKVARRFKEPIFGPDKGLQKKQYGPGQHGPSKRSPKKSEYSVQLGEKQKMKYTYGVLERQFALTFAKANRKKGSTGENLIKFLEARLDNTVFRLGIAPTREAGRQLVSHRHIVVNGKVVNIPSYQLNPGDIVGVREKSKNLETIVDAVGSKMVSKFNWLEWNREKLEGRFLDFPERDQIPENFKEQLIVELYSK